MLVQSEIVVSLVERLIRLFSGIGIAIGVGTLLYAYYGTRLPTIFQYSFLFGKIKPTVDLRLEVLRIPKRWFTYFYATGIFTTLCALFLEITAASINRTILCAMLVFLSHVARRFYECRSVSVFGNSQMSITHFVLSILYYIAVPFAIYTSRLQAAERSPLSMVLFVICVFGVQFCQDLTFQQLANLRNSIKYEKGGNCADKYFVPTGSMFQYVTCPHYLLEITLYLSIHIFLTTQWTSFSHILVFVVINQICSAWLNHMWYKEHFPEWANERAALFPGVL